MVKASSATTESIDLRYEKLETWPTATALSEMLKAQQEAVAAIEAVLPVLAEAAEAAAVALQKQGRLIYVGAGTSARIGVQDGAELPPTFNWPKERVAFVIAGGPQALLQSVEEAEDDAQKGAAEIAKLAPSSSDVVIGLTASGTTPFTVGALQAATDAGAVTIGVANNAGTPLLKAARFAVPILTGAEVVAGSTRMKAGTAQKIVLNLLSTAIMIRLGHVYRGLMVNMRPTNAKLRLRAARMVAYLTGRTEEEAQAFLRQTGGDIRRAVEQAKTP